VGLLSDYARRKRIELLLAAIPRDARILEVGAGDGAVGRWLRENGWSRYTGLDVRPPADVVGSITDWRALGLRPESFDAIIAFEVLEHVPCHRECLDLLRPGGELILTTPVPHLDWLCKLMESAGISQRRTSPHNHLVYVEDIPGFEPVASFRFMLTGQWARLRKPA
jgi:2-polyprenyl-3-methyl-5-hydroxy-6-metoxy-1,4-benzoquinol methylase